MTLKIPRRLESPNTWQGRHWSVKHRISQEWEQEVWAQVARQTKARSVVAVLGVMNAIPALKRRPESIGRMRVEVTRQVSKARHFIRDDDNLRFSVKPLMDSLKRLGYIRDDSRKWLEHPTPTQSVSPDGKDYTIVTIEPL